MGKIVLMDGHNILRKAYYSVPVMTDSAGFHTNAIVGFLNILLKIAEKEKSEYLGVIFGAQERVEQMPDGLREQIPLLKEVLSAMKIFLIEKAEIADADLIGTVAERIQGDVVLVSGNHDLLQLVSGKTRLCMPETGGGQTVWKDYTAADVEAAYKLVPAQFPELNLLTRVAKIGERTACDLLSTYGSLEAIYAHIDDLPQKSIRETLADKKADIDSGKDVYTINTKADIDFYDRFMNDMKLESEGTVTFTPEAGAKLKTLSLGSQFEQSVQTGKTLTLDIDKDIRVVAVRTAEDAQAVFGTAAKAGNAAIRLVHVRAKSGGGFGANADGQMFLQLDTEEEVFGCIVCGGSADEKNIHYIESGGAISEDFLKKQVEQLLLSGKVSVSVFDVKNNYGDMISTENDRKLSSDTLTRQLFDCKIAAYLVNPLKSDYEIADVAQEYLNIQLPKWSDLFGKSDFNSIFRGRREECLSLLAKETFVLYKARPLLEEALRRNNMDKLFRELEMPLTYVLFDMEREGILVKPEELKAYGEALNGRIGELEEAIHTAAGEGFNINSPKQLGEILFEKLKLPGGKRPKRATPRRRMCLTNLRRTIRLSRISWSIGDLRN